LSKRRKPAGGPSELGATVESLTGRSVGQITHDLTNVMTGVLGYAEIIVEDARGSKVDVRDAEQLLAATREAVALIKVLRASV
jgi:hypothetical protein